MDAKTPGCLTLESNVQIASLTGFIYDSVPIGSGFVFGPLCKHHLHVRNTLKLAQLQLSVNTQFVALMHIITKSKSISSKTSLTKHPFICTKEQLALEMCWSQPVSSRGQNLASKTKQPF